MTENAALTVSCENSGTIPVNCVPFGGSRGFATLTVDKRGEEIVLDVQITGGCVQIILDEAAGAALFDLLGTWLAGVEIG